MADKKRLLSLIEGYSDQMLKSMVKMVFIKAISPQSGGFGESKRADYLKSLLESMNFKVKRYDYKDELGYTRSNLIVVHGDKRPRIWIVSHIDTVGEGDPALWKHDPFKARVESGKIYGRGTNDDGQDVIASVYALKALKESKFKLGYGVGLALVADEELGSVYGIVRLLEEKGLFNSKDMFLVPDFSTPQGYTIEIAEKGLLWVKITVHGKQVHASTPEHGVNAFRYMVRFLNKADMLLHKKYNKTSNLFWPKGSTFEMTKHEKGVDSVNIVPGVEVAYMDCRVLPEYELDDVLKTLRQLAKNKEFKDVKIDIEPFHRDDATQQTDPNSKVVELLKRALSQVGIAKPKVIGMGGGTCAAFFRRRGLPAVAWSRKPDIAHQPNEYAELKDIVFDAKVFALMCVAHG